MTCACPACGQPLPETAPALAAPVTPTMRRILDIVARRPGITADELADLIYAADPNGGPTNGRNVVSAIVCHNRHRLAAAGWRVRGGQGSGYRLVRA